MPDDTQTSMTGSHSLLSAQDPAPFELVNRNGASPLLLVCEHAGRAVPVGLAGLDLSSAEMDKHIAWDIGAEAVARALSAQLDAPLMLQRYSRLVIDANRPLAARDCIPEISDGVAIPGNQALSAVARQARYDAIHRPFHAAVSDFLDQRATRGTPSHLASVHSFTPSLGGVARSMSVGLLFNRDRRLAEALRAALMPLVPGHEVAMNAPYRVDDNSDYAMPVHGEARGLPHVLIELRNDLITEPGGQEDWAAYLGAALPTAIKSLESAP